MCDCVKRSPCCTMSYVFFPHWFTHPAGARYKYRLPNLWAFSGLEAFSDVGVYMLELPTTIGNYVPPLKA